MTELRTRPLPIVDPLLADQRANDFSVSRVTGFGSVGKDAEWQRYCGFLDLRLEQFMEIQARLLGEQIALVSETPLGKQLLKGRRPATVEEFRQTAPLTTYGDYVEAFVSQDPGVLGDAPLLWAHTTGAQAGYKWVPYTQRGFERTLDSLMACFILASAERRGQVNFGPNSTVLYNAPERPYLSGLVTFGMQDRFGLKGVLDPGTSEGMDFRERIREGFKQALGKKVDVVVSMSSILAKVGQEFEEHSRHHALGREMLAPRALWRLAKAAARRKLLRQQVLPRHLWPTKAIVGWGMDSYYFKEDIQRYWGSLPFEAYACTEGGLMGVQSWERRGVVFIPYADFFEFIPIEDSIRSQADNRIRPTTVLLDEVEPGETYELVLTNFYGMGLMRYRVGHYLQFLAESDPATTLPEFRLVERSDQRIDLAGFTRLDEKTVWEALRKVGIEHQDWTVRKENEDDKLQIHMYLEMKAGQTSEHIEDRLHEAFRSVDSFYRDLEAMLGLRPLRVTCLTPGTFERFYDLRRQMGYDLSRRTPSRMSASDDDVADLIGCSIYPPRA